MLATMLLGVQALPTSRVNSVFSIRSDAAVEQLQQCSPLFCAVLCCVVLCLAVLCCAVLCCAGLEPSQFTGHYMGGRPILKRNMLVSQGAQTKKKEISRFSAIPASS